jgi:hypothetical protein
MSNAQGIEHWEELYRYWLSRHVDGQPPRRSDIDPMIDLAHMAANLIMIELRPDGPEYRLVGSTVVKHFGVDRTGKLVGTSGVDVKQLTAWRSAVVSAARDGLPRLLVSHYPGAEKSQTIALVLPLAPDPEGTVKLFAGTFFGRPFPNTGAFKDLIVSKVALDL